MHFAEQYLNKKWQAGARGPDTFDCWGLVYWIYKQHFNVELPSYPCVNALNLKQVTQVVTDESKDLEWFKLENAVDNCVVAMSKNTKHLHHVGLYLDVDGGLVLHALDERNVIAQPLRDLTRTGWRRVEFYKHRAML